MKNILYIPQLSMYDKKSKEFIPAADGNINMLRNTINEWKKWRKDDKFYILLPLTIEFYPAGKIMEELKINSTPIYYDGFVTSARINRFNFPLDEITRVIKNKNIAFDLIISDVIELSTNIKQMFNINFGYTPKIISNIRHLDDEINYTYLFRVVDGIHNSDLVTILSESMRNTIINQLSSMLNFDYAWELISKINVFEPSVSFDEINYFMASNKIEKTDKVIITFPGRLSIGEEKRTNWDKFMDAILKLRQSRDDFEVYLTDPNNSYNGLKFNWVKFIEKDRKEFFKLLHKTDIIVSLMATEGFGGISPREALLFNCRPVIPYVSEYKKMAPSNYLGFINEVTVEQLVNVLHWAISKGKKLDIESHGYYGYKFSIEKQFKNIKPKLEELLND